VFATALVLLLSPRGDVAYLGAVTAAVGVICSVLCAAIIKFAVLPALETFPAFCVALGLFFVPLGFVMAWNQRPAVTALLNALGFAFVPLLAPTNLMSYDTTQFYNSSLAIVFGCSVAPLTFLLLPPPPPAERARRLLRLTLRDLRRLADGRWLPRLEDWEGRIYSRLAAVPDQAEPLQRAQLLAALSVGAEIIHLRRTASGLGLSVELEAALAGFARGDSAGALGRLRLLDCRLSSCPEDGAGTATALRARSRILVISEALSEHGSYFDAGSSA
jgi:uncharacterized membrane protein YccC